MSGIKTRGADECQEAGGLDNHALSLDDEGAIQTLDSRNNVEQSPTAAEEGPTFEDLKFEPNWISRIEDRMASTKKSLLKRVRGENFGRLLPKIIVAVLFNIYFICSVRYYIVNNPTNGDIEWCEGLGFLIISTVLFYLLLLYFKVVKPFCCHFLASPRGRHLSKSLLSPIKESYQSVMAKPMAVPALYAVVLAAVIIFLAVDTAGDQQRLTSALGVVVLVFLGFVISKHPARVVWRHVVWGLLLQLLFGIAILRWEVGRSTFECLGSKVSTFLSYTDSGSAFVFGYLASPTLRPPFNVTALNESFPSSVALEVATDIIEADAFNWVFMFHILSVMYFFSFFISMLFYLGWMQWVVVKIGWMLQVTVGTTACESLNAAANIFLGQSEAPLMIKPYLPLMTSSELHAVMTGGFATIAGTVLAAYISFGVSASHLLSASVMSAPAALAMAKLVYPETKKTKTSPEDLERESAVAGAGTHTNLLDAASDGATTAVLLVANIAGSLVAMLAFVSFLNGILSWCGRLVGQPELSLEGILGFLFIPLAWVMGVSPDDVEEVGVLIGLKTLVNEFAAYGRMQEYEGVITERSKVIATYALCGFANPASIGIQLAALSSMAPTRRSDVASVVLRAFVSGSMACFLTACIAGMLYEETASN